MRASFFSQETRPRPKTKEELSRQEHEKFFDMLKKLQEAEGGSSDSLPLSDFAGIYSDKMIASDKARVERCKEMEKSKEEGRISGYRELYGEDPAKESDWPKIFEHLLLKQCEESGWMNMDDGSFKHAMYRTTEFDDRIHHIDFISEWQREDGEIVRIAFDVTLASEKKFESFLSDTAIRGEVKGMSPLLKKIKRAERYTRQGSGYAAKYFQTRLTEDGNPKKIGHLGHLPIVIIKVTPENFQKLCAYEYQRLLKLPHSQEDMANNCFQVSLLEESLHQLQKHELILSRDTDEDSVAFKEEVRKSVALIRELLENKKDRLSIKNDDPKVEELSARLAS